MNTMINASAEAPTAIPAWHLSQDLHLIEIEPGEEELEVSRAVASLSLLAWMLLVLVDRVVAVLDVLKVVG